MKKQLCVLAIATLVGIGTLSTSTFAAQTKVPNELKTVTSELKTTRDKIKSTKELNKEAIKNLESAGVKKSVVKAAIKDSVAEKKAIRESNKSLKDEIKVLSTNVKEAKKNSDTTKVRELKKSLVEKKIVLNENLNKILSILNTINTTIKNLTV